MSYIPALDQVQLGQETVWGTSVAGTGKLGLISDCTIEPEIEVETLKDIRGSRLFALVCVIRVYPQTVRRWRANGTQITSASGRSAYG